MEIKFNRHLVKYRSYRIWLGIVVVVLSLVSRGASAVLDRLGADK